MLAFIFLLSTMMAIYIKVLLLRVWMQCAYCDFYNPFSQFVVKITQPLVKPLHRIIPSIGSVDTSSLLIAYIISVLLGQLALHMFVLGPIFFYLGLLILVKSSGVLVFWIIIIRSLMSWISQGQNPVDYILIQITEPLMAPIRRIIPTMLGIDFSALILILILYILNFLGLEYIPGWVQF